MGFPYGETIIRQRAALVADPMSGRDTRADWDDPANPPTELPIPGVAFDPGGSSEPVTADSARRVITQPTVYDPTYADVTSGDRIVRVLTGVVYEVDGNPAAWRSPFTGWAPGQVIALKIVEG